MWSSRRPVFGSLCAVLGMSWGCPVLLSGSLGRVLGCLKPSGNWPGQVLGLLTANLTPKLQKSQQFRVFDSFYSVLLEPLLTLYAKNDDSFAFLTVFIQGFWKS